jgi:hypothetical protein
MEQRYFVNSWLLPCSLRSHRIANSSPKNGLRHFSALPTHHPSVVAKQANSTTESKVESHEQFDRYRKYFERTNINFKFT